MTVRKKEARYFFEPEHHLFFYCVNLCQSPESRNQKNKIILRFFQENHDVLMQSNTSITEELKYYRSITFLISLAQLHEY